MQKSLIWVMIFFVSTASLSTNLFAEMKVEDYLAVFEKNYGQEFVQFIKVKKMDNVAELRSMQFKASTNKESFESDYMHKFVQYQIATNKKIVEEVEKLGHLYNIPSFSLIDNISVNTVIILGNWLTTLTTIGFTSDGNHGIRIVFSGIKFDFMKNTPKPVSLSINTVVNPETLKVQKTEIERL